MDSGFEWPRWLKSNMDMLRRSYEYVVVAGPRRRVDRVLTPDYERVLRRGEIELLANRGKI